VQQMFGDSFVSGEAADAASRCERRPGAIDQARLRLLPAGNSFGGIRCIWTWKPHQAQGSMKQNWPLEETLQCRRGS